MIQSIDGNGATSDGSAAPGAYQRVQFATLVIRQRASGAQFGVYLITEALCTLTIL